MVATGEIALVGDNKSSALVVKRARPVGLKVSSRPATARRVGRTCRNPACSKNPYFGWHGEKAIYCVTHKEPGASRERALVLSVLGVGVVRSVVRFPEIVLD